MKTRDSNLQKKVCELHFIMQTIFFPKIINYEQFKPNFKAQVYTRRQFHKMYLPYQHDQ